MMEDMFGDFQARQEAIQLKLEGIFVKADAGDGAMLITANGNGQIYAKSVDASNAGTYGIFAGENGQIYVHSANASVNPLLEKSIYILIGNFSSIF